MHIEMTYLSSLLIAGYAAISDLKSRTIKNEFLFDAFIFELTGAISDYLLALLNGSVTADNGFVMFAEKFAGMVYTPLILLIPYLMKGFGAADIKLLAILGLGCGIGRSLKLLIYSLIIGALIGIIGKKKEIPFAVCIFAGVLLVIGSDLLVI